MGQVSEQITTDGQRVVESREGEQDVVREATLGEQVDARAGELLETIQKTFVGVARSGSISTATSGDVTTITVKLSTQDELYAEVPKSKK